MSKEDENDDLVNDILGTIGTEESPSADLAEESSDENSEETNQEETTDENVVEVTAWDPNGEESTDDDFENLEVEKEEETEEEEEKGEEKPKEGEEKKGEEKPKEGEEKPKEGEEKPKEGEEEKDEHAEILEKEVPGGAHAKESTRKDWESLKTAAKSYKEKLEEQKTKLAEIEAAKVELEKKLTEAPTQLPPETEKELEYLKNQLAKYEVSELPEFKEKFDNKIARIEAGVMGWFEGASKDPSRQVPELDEEGNPTGKMIPASEVLSEGVVKNLKSAVEGSGFTKYRWDKWIQQCLDRKLITSIEARSLESSIASAMNLESNKKVEMEQARKTWEDTRAQEAAREKELTEQHKGKVKDIAGKTVELLTEIQEKEEWARQPDPLPTNASSEEKAAHEKQVNKFLDRSAKFSKALKAFYGSQGIRFQGDDTVDHWTPEEFAGVLKDAFTTDVVRGELDKVKAELAEAEKELTEFRAGGSTTPRSGSRTAVEKSQPKAIFPGTTAEEILASIG